MEIEIRGFINPEHNPDFSLAPGPVKLWIKVLDREHITKIRNIGYNPRIAPEGGALIKVSAKRFRPAIGVRMQSTPDLMNKEYTVRFITKRYAYGSTTKVTGLSLILRHIDLYV